VFEVTSQAAARLAHRLSEERAIGQTFRFVREDHGWRLLLGHVSNGDTIIQHQGRPVLAFDSAVASGLADRTLDLRNTTAGGRLRLARRTS